MALIFASLKLFSEINIKPLPQVSGFTPAESSADFLRTSSFAGVASASFMSWILCRNVHLLRFSNGGHVLAAAQVGWTSLYSVVDAFVAPSLESSTLMKQELDCLDCVSCLQDVVGWDSNKSHTVSKR